MARTITAYRRVDEVAMSSTGATTFDPRPVARVLLVTDRILPTPDVLAAMRDRSERGPAQFRVLLPNPAVAEIHLLHPERHDQAAAAERALREALPRYEAAVGAVLASVSIRHDAYDAVEELMLVEPVDEILVWVRSTHRRLGRDLSQRLRHLGRPVLALPVQPGLPAPVLA